MRATALLAKLALSLIIPSPTPPIHPMLTITVSQSPLFTQISQRRQVLWNREMTKHRKYQLSCCYGTFTGLIPKKDSFILISTPKKHLKWSILSWIEAQAKFEPRQDCRKQGATRSAGVQSKCHQYLLTPNKSICQPVPQVFVDTK